MWTKYTLISMCQIVSTCLLRYQSGGNWRGVGYNVTQSFLVSCLPIILSVYPFASIDLVPQGGGAEKWVG